MSDQYQVTSMGVNPADDRAQRMRMYFLAMSVRVLCIVSLFWVRGWWILLVGAGAVILPYLAVLLANAVDHRTDGDKAEAPTPLQLETLFSNAAEEDSDSHVHTTIVIEADEYRRSSERPE